MKNSKKNQVRKYIRNIMMLMCVAMLAGILLPGVHTEAAAQKTKALKAYNKLLASDSIKRTDDGMTQNPADCSFALVYIDNNNVPELVIDCGGSLLRYAVYTYKNGKAQYVTNAGGIFGYYKKKGIFTGGVGVSYICINYVKLSSGKSVKKFSFIEYNGSATYQSYQSNKTVTITKAKFNRQLKKLVGSTKETTNITWHKNTAANRKKYLK